ncbi:MAG: cation:proton antiporter [Candidatus Syntrophoarchaeum sp. WYZ-LMO15]|nr:MAG: cation:proton antiporter [Candidatus Syntrophoarchaeum sp. WYZ-LMO15]
MAEVMLFLELGLALLLAKLCGELFERMGQPAVIGEILAGVILGGEVLGGYLGIDLLGEPFKAFADVGVMILLFLSGVEVEFAELKKTGKLASAVALGGVLLPFIGGYAVMIWFGYGYMEALLVGATLTATSVGVTARILMDVGALNTRAGTSILGAAVIDDVLGIIILAIISGIAMVGDIEVESLLLLAVKIAIFFIITLFLGLRLIGRVADFENRMVSAKAFLALSLALGFIFGVFAEKMQIAAITGAFVAGLIVGETPYKKMISEDVKVIGYGFFIPLFFVFAGAWIDFSSFASAGAVIIAALIVAILGKIIGCGIPALAMRSSPLESLIIGVGMVPRMEIGLIVAAIGVNLGMAGDPAGIVAKETLSLAVVVSIVTGLFPLFFMKKLLERYLEEGT